MPRLISLHNAPMELPASSLAVPSTPARVQHVVAPRSVRRSPCLSSAAEHWRPELVMMTALFVGIAEKRCFRLPAVALSAKKEGKETKKAKDAFSNKIRTFFGRVYALFSLPFGGAGNFAQVDQGSVGVVLRFGKFDRMLDPGRHQFNVAVEKVMIVPLKIACIDVQPQMVMTKDNLTVTIDAVCFYRVLDATKVLFEVQNYQQALSNLVQVTMRTVVGENDLSEIFAQRPRLNARITELIDAATGPWGIEVSQVELKEVQIQQSMQRALAAVAEAQQEAEAKLIQARAQRESASILAEASKAMGNDAAALQLQWFETLRIIATQGKNATVIVPDRIDPESALRVTGNGSSGS